ncbi:MAG: hypothetical protein IKJ35_08475 [Clostridia bacterium]|nr:hypothetical protein [Clostridia bacterium]
METPSTDKNLTDSTEETQSTDKTLSTDKNLMDSTEETQSTDKTPATDEMLMDLVSKIYNESELLEIVNFDGSIKGLNTKYPIECMRTIADIYRVSYLGSDRVAVIVFDDSGSKMWGRIYPLTLSKDAFDNVVEGQSLETVMKIDPNGEYLFLYTGRNDFPRTSAHYTKDGYLITIEYDDSNTIIGIREELI